MYDPTSKFQEQEIGSDLIFLQSKIKICKTYFELFFILHFLSLRKICLTDFYFTLHEC